MSQINYLGALISTSKYSPTLKTFISSQMVEIIELFKKLSKEQRNKVKCNLKLKWETILINEDLLSVQGQLLKLIYTIIPPTRIAYYKLKIKKNFETPNKNEIKINKKESTIYLNDTFIDLPKDLHFLAFKLRFQKYLFERKKNKPFKNKIHFSRYFKFIFNLNLSSLIIIYNRNMELLKKKSMF
jgi:hypothetical protein